MGSYTDLPRSHGGVEKHRVCERGSRLLRVDRNGGGKNSATGLGGGSDGAGSDGGGTAMELAAMASWRAMELAITLHGA